ncbi:unnamed protein product [Gongylonema pulchrum]|uniref:GAIN domain-containing protein n=1 Tax=Gongylonema pulchrum TaxID=637853 RepID=A0A183D437_9BILA|nr:unnamed protein product [Gongylonema pulchrum]
MAKESQSAAWKDLKGVKHRKVADVLMNNVDQVSMAVSSLITPDTPRIVMKPNIGIFHFIEVELEISDVRVHDYVTFPSMSLYRTTYDTVDIPREALTLRNNAIDYAKVLYVSYSSMAEHLKAAPRESADGSVVPRHVASKVVSASLINEENKIQSIDHLQKPVIITFLMEVTTFHIYF